MLKKCLCVCRCYLRHTCQCSSPGLAGFLPMAQHQCCKLCAQTPINQQTCLISSPGQTPAAPQPLSFPRYSPSVLENLSQGGTHIFSFAPGLPHLLSAYSCWEKYEILSEDLLIPIQNANPCVHLHQCHVGWLSHQQYNLSWFVGPNPSKSKPEKPEST